MFGIQAFSRLVLMLVGILSNGCIIRAIVKDVLMRTFSNKLLLVIAIADLGACVVIMPFSFIAMCTDRWPFGRSFCNLLAFFGEFFERSSTIMLPVVVFEKHLHIAHRNLTRVSKRGITLVIFLILLTACIFSLPYPRVVIFDRNIGACNLVYSSTEGNISLAVFAIVESILFKFIPLGLLLVSFVKIFTNIRRRRHAAMAQNGLTVPTLTDLENLRLISDQYTAWTTLFVALPFVILKIPNSITYGYLAHFLKSKFTRGPSKVFAFWCMLINPVLRPLIYGLRNQRCRKYIRRCFKRMKRHCMMKGWCLGTAWRAGAYVLPKTDVIELKPGALEAVKTDNYDVTKKESRLKSKDDVIKMAPTGSPLYSQSMIRSVIIVGTDDNVIGNISDDCAHQPKLAQTGDEMLVEDIEVYLFDEIDKN